MKLFAAIVMVTILASPAAAVIEPDPDLIGIYFDTSGDVGDYFISPSIPFFAYVMVLNPTEPQITSCEFGWDIHVSAGMEGMFFRLALTSSGDIPVNTEQLDVFADDVTITWSEPLPAIPATPVLSFQFMLLAPMVGYIEITPGQDNLLADGLPAYANGESVRALGTPSCSGQINQSCGLATEPSTFGAVKALYR